MASARTAASAVCGKNCEKSWLRRLRMARAGCALRSQRKSERRSESSRCRSSGTRRTRTQSRTRPTKRRTRRTVVNRLVHGSTRSFRTRISCGYWTMSSLSSRAWPRIARRCFVARKARRSCSATRYQAGCCTTSTGRRTSRSSRRACCSPSTGRRFSRVCSSGSFAGWTRPCSMTL